MICLYKFRFVYFDSNKIKWSKCKYYVENNKLLDITINKTKFGQFYLVTPRGVKNGKFVTLTPFQKNRPTSMKPPRPTQRKFAFKLSYSTTTIKNKETLHIFDRFITYWVEKHLFFSRVVTEDCLIKLIHVDETMW